MSKPLIFTRDMAWSAAIDAANRKMREQGKQAWGSEEYIIAAETFARLWPKCRDQYQQADREAIRKAEGA